MNMETLTINDELKQLIPPLSADERKQLEANIIAEGCRDPLVVWQGTIIDGHNRYEICKANGIEFETTEMEFADIDAVKVWMIDNQKGRRNLTDGWKYELAQARKALLLEKGKATQGKRTDILSTIDKKLPEEKHNTRDEIATDLGWSTGKVAMADKVWKDAKPEVKEKVKAGEISINEAYREIKKPNVHVSNNSGENEWYTPRPIIEQARQVLGSIELDPASSAKAQEVVQAKQYFTKHNSGLNKQWEGKLWMNPPYAQPLISQFASKLVESLKSGSVTEGIVLVNNATETAWFQQMLAEAAAVCFIKGRLKFIDAQGNPSGAPLQGQVLLYFGAGIDGFKAAFAQTGICLVK